MKNNVMTVMKKEFARFFGDRRMILMMLMPGVLIYLIYTFMGSALTSMYAPDEEHIPAAYVVNMPEDIAQITRMRGIEIHVISENEVDGIKYMVTSKEADICAVFPPDFIGRMNGYVTRPPSEAAPNVEVYFNSVEPNSQSAYMNMLSILDEYKSSIVNLFDVNKGVASVDLAAKEDVSASIISSLMPMLLMIFLCSGCMGLAPDAIAGEKERGTIATLLVTPLKRSELAGGKILSLAILSFLSGLITAGATILSLPKLMEGAEDYIDAGIYGATDYLLLALVILSTILLLVALFSIISAFAKSVKEANTAVVPLMIVVMLVGVSGMFGGAQKDTALYFIPLYSSVQCMSGIFSLNYDSVNIAVSCVSTFVYAIIGGVALTRMFNSEKVMFSK